MTYNQLLDIAKQLFDALDDECRFLVNTNISEVQETTLDALKNAQHAGIGKSKAIPEYEAIDWD